VKVTRNKIKVGDIWINLNCQICHHLKYFPTFLIIKAKKSKHSAYCQVYCLKGKYLHDYPLHMFNPQRYYASELGQFNTPVGPPLFHEVTLKKLSDFKKEDFLKYEKES